MGEDFTELLEVFLSSSDELMRDLVEALAAGDAVAFHRHAHTLKSSSGQVGARRLAALARALEADAKQAVPPDASARVAAIREEYRRVHDCLSCHLRTEQVQP
jgi:HPt (histidine-containing phosphotransfer) domain-containing protein